MLNICPSRDLQVGTAGGSDCKKSVHLQPLFQAKARDKRDGGRSLSEAHRPLGVWVYVVNKSQPSSYHPVLYL